LFTAQVLSTILSFLISQGRQLRKSKLVQKIWT